MQSIYLYVRLIQTLKTQEEQRGSKGATASGFAKTKFPGVFYTPKVMLLSVTALRKLFQMESIDFS